MKNHIWISEDQNMVLLSDESNLVVPAELCIVGQGFILEQNGGPNMPELLQEQNKLENVE